MGESKFEETESKCEDDTESKSSHLESKSSSEKKTEENTDEVNIVTKAIRYCFSHKFIGIFERYIKDNAHIFFDAVDDEEHKLEYTESFQDYLKLFESTMDTWVAEQGYTLETFYSSLRDVQCDGDTSEKHFLKLLFASAEYDCYYEVMVAEATTQVRKRLAED